MIRDDEQDQDEKEAEPKASLETKPVGALDETDAAAELARLAAEIAHHDELYYREDEPEISDADYDALRARNDEIEARFPELCATTALRSRWVRHRSVPSAKWRTACRCCRSTTPSPTKKSKAFSLSAKAFLGLAPDQPLEVTAEPKIDGFSITLRYERGRLVQGATRGDGYEGEDVTANVRTIADIPKSVSAKDFPAAFEVRGEIYMRHADFEKLNSEQASKGSRSSPIPRNAAAGFVRQLDPSVTAQAALALLRLWLGRRRSPAGRHSMGLLPGAERLGLSGQSADAAHEQHRGDAGNLSADRGAPRRRSATTSTASSTRSIASISNSASAFARARRDGRSLTNFRPRRRPPSCATSISRWAAPAR